MHLINSPRRLIGAAAIAGAAALIPVAALAAATAPAAPAASTPGCATSGLVIWLNDIGGYAGGTGAYIEFTNLSGHACTLRGTPGVSAVNLGGRQLGRAASGDYSGDTPAVRLASGATATAELLITDPGNLPQCFTGPPPRPGRGPTFPTAAGLRIYPPNQLTSKVVPYPFGACGHTGVVWMHAGPTQKGSEHS